MRQYTIQSLIALSLAANLMAAAPAVGLMTAGGSFTIDNSSITGNATLFEGSQIETGKVSSQLQLNNGAKMLLAAESRGIVYRDRLVLERGSGRVENYSVEALSLRIRPDAGNAADVSVRNSSAAGPGLVQVAALNGPVRVIASNGVLLANIQAGRTLAFVPDAAAKPAGPTTVTGCVESASGKLLLTDETSLVRFEVAGAGVGKEVGHRVEISGTVTPVPESLSRVQSTSVKQLSKKCSNRTTAAAAAGVGAAGAGAAGAGAGAAGAAGAGSAGAATAAGVGMAVGAKAIIAGVIIAGAATGTAVAVVKSGDSTPAISPSGR